MKTPDEDDYDAVLGLCASGVVDGINWCVTHDCMTWTGTPKCLDRLELEDMIHRMLDRLAAQHEEEKEQE